MTHPTYPSLARLDLCMAMCYNEFETPHPPQPIQPSMVCAAPSAGGWYRAKVIAVHPPTPADAAAADAAAAAAYIIPLDAQVANKNSVLLGTPMVLQSVALGGNFDIE